MDNKLDIPDVLSDSLWERAYPIFEKLISDNMTAEQKSIAKWNILQVILAYEEDDSLEELAKNEGMCFSHRFNYEKWINEYKNDTNQFRLRHRKYKAETNTNNSMAWKEVHLNE